MAALRQSMISMAGAPEISVLVCTRNRSRALGRCLGALGRQSADFPFEVIVVDNGSTDETEAVVASAAQEDGNVRYVREPETGLSRARNRGAAEARADVLAYLDDDAEPVGGWLKALHSAFAETDASVVGGPILARFEVDGPDWLTAHVGRLSCQDFGPVRRVVDFEPYLFGANFAIRAAELRAVGGFDPLLGRNGTRLLANEETEVCERLLAERKSLLYEPRAVVFHWFGAERLSRPYLRRRAFDTGRTLGFRWMRALDRRRLVRMLAAKGAKLPLHLLLWGTSELTFQHETALARERSALVTIGAFAEILRPRRTA